MSHYGTRLWPCNYDKKNTTINTENAIRTYKQKRWCGCCHTTLRPQDHQKSRLQENRQFEILANIGTSAYKLALPPSMAIHNTFHISLLEPYQKPGSHRRSNKTLLLFRYKEKTNTKATKSSTLDSTTTSSNIEPSGKDTPQNTTKSGTRQKTSTMQNTQSNDSTGATQQTPEGIHFTSNRLSSGPPRSSKKNDARTPRKASHNASHRTLPPLAQRTGAHQDRRWHMPP